MSNTIIQYEFQKGEIAQMAERVVVIYGPYRLDGLTITQINKKHTGLATLLEGAGCVRNFQNISKNSKINYGVNKAVRLDNHGIYIVVWIS